MGLIKYCYVSNKPTNMSLVIADVGFSWKLDANEVILIRMIKWRV
jgi:hypothetical protein